MNTEEYLKECEIFFFGTKEEQQEKINEGYGDRMGFDFDNELSYEMISDVIGQENEEIIKGQLDIKIREFCSKPELLQGALFQIGCHTISDESSPSEEKKYEDFIKKGLHLCFRAFPEEGEYIYRYIDLIDGGLFKQRFSKILIEIEGD